MNKKKKLIVQVTLLIVILLVFAHLQHLFFSWESAYHHLEQYEHFGPASELHMLNDSDDRYILAKYDRWIAIFLIYQQYGLFYRPGSMATPLEIQQDQEISIQTGRAYFEEGQYIVYAYAKDPITVLKVDLTDGSSFTLEPLAEHIYFGHWPWAYREEEEKVVKVRGYDESGELVCEKKVE